MSNAATERNTPKRGAHVLPEVHSLPMKASTTILKGTIVVLDSTGYAKGPSAATTLITAGRAAETVDNSAGASGDLKIRVEPGQFRYNNSASTDAIGVTEVGKDCYLVDNQTVAKTDASGTRSRAGKVMDVDTDGVWVLLGLGL